jgi:hypothetical protein
VPIAVLDGPEPRPAPVVTDGLDDRRAPYVPAGRGVAELPVAREVGRLPLGRLAGLAGSGAFALWTSVTCFVC